MDSPQPYSPYPVERPTSGAAIASLVLGIISLVTCALTAIPAVICGHIGLSAIKQGQFEGRGMAIAGLVMGYLTIAFWTVLLLLVIAGIGMSVPIFSEIQKKMTEMTEQTPDQTAVEIQLKAIGASCRKFAEDHQGRFPATLEELVPDYIGDRSELLGPDHEPFEYMAAELSDAPSKIVAATRPVPGKRRVVLRRDGSTEIEKTELK